MAPLRFLDLCAGAGGLSLGFLRAGYNVAGVEKDSDAAATHERHVGPCTVADMAEYHPDGAYDVVGGGVPCTSFSLAGSRGGLEDPRGQLYLHLLRIAGEAKASVVFIENVRGILSWRNENGTAFGQILSAFIAHGYTPVWSLLDAADYGVPQKRVRLFLIGFRDPRAAMRFRWPQPTHAPRGGLFGLPPYRTVREALSLSGSFEKDKGGRVSSLQGMRNIDVDAPGYTIGTRNNADLLVPAAGEDPVLDAPAHVITTRSGQPGEDEQRPSRRPLGVLARKLQGEATGVLDEPSPTITATEYKASAQRGSRGGVAAPRRASERLGDALSALDTEPVSAEAPAAELVTAEAVETPATDEPKPAKGGKKKRVKKASSDPSASPPVAAEEQTSEQLAEKLDEAGLLNRPATTIDSRGAVSKAGHHESNKTGAVRLSVEQGALLQSFPRGWTWEGSKESQWRQVGNAVPPPLAEAVGGAIHRALSTPDKSHNTVQLGLGLEESSHA